MPESQKQQIPTPASTKRSPSACIRQVQSALARERERIARELHDELGSTLTALRLEVAALRNLDTTGNGELARRMHYLNELLSQCVSAKRGLVQELWPTPETGVCLQRQLRGLCADMAALHGAPHIHCTVQGSAALAELPDAVAHAGYRVVQEAVTNALAHAAAHNVHVQVRALPPWLHLEVLDDGRGFHPAALASGRHGLASMRSRVQELQGRWQLHSAPGQGTRLQVALPLQALVKPVL